MNRPLNLLAVALTSLFVIVNTACKSTTEPTTTNNASRPGVGSTYIVQNQWLDSNNAVVNSETDTSTVISSGISYQGKNNVVALRIGNATNGIVAYIQYEANGDLSLYSPDDGPGARPGWITYPIASKGTSTLVTYDTTEVYNGTTHHTVVTDSWTYVGDETVTEAGESFNTEMLRGTRTNQDGYRDYTETDDFSSRIGYPVRVVLNYTVSSHGAVREESHLISYTLK